MVWLNTADSRWRISAMAAILPETGGSLSISLAY